MSEQLRFMKSRNESTAFPQWWRWMLIATAVLVLCSCRSLTDQKVDTETSLAPVTTLPPRAMTGIPIGAETWQDPTGSVQLASLQETLPATAYACPQCNNNRGTLPLEAFCGPPTDGYSNSFRPPGIAGPWPSDEYICDGGDAFEEVLIKNDFSVNGLNIEDTVVHYDTVDGRVAVEPSNRVCIYAPRFAAVRQVRGMRQNEGQLVYVGIDTSLQVIDDPHYQVATHLTQPIQPIGQIGSLGTRVYRERLRGIGIENSQGLVSFHYGFMPYEDLQLIRNGVLINGEKARLATSIDSAIAWTGNQEVQLVIDEKRAHVETQDTQMQGVDVYESPEGNRMRIVKLASRTDALPGEIVEFTLRFDNVGVETVGNVTIIDNLTARLEYVPESSLSTVDAEFFSQLNENGSLVLRWEIAEPLAPGEGGVIRFQCRVR